MFTPTDELKIGQVVEVSGTSIKVEISDKISSAIEGYKIQSDPKQNQGRVH